MAMHCRTLMVVHRKIQKNPLTLEVILQLFFALILFTRMHLNCVFSFSIFLSLLDIFVHELSVEVAPEAVVDESLLLFVWLGPGAIFEDDVVVPAPFEPQV